MFKQGEKLRTIYVFMDLTMVAAALVTEIIVATLMNSNGMLHSDMTEYIMHFILAPTVMDILGVIIAYIVYRLVKSESVKNAIHISGIKLSITSVKGIAFKKRPFIIRCRNFGLW